MVTSRQGPEAAGARRPPSGGRLDARQKATGATLYTADIPFEDALHVALVRSPLPRARINGVGTASALGGRGVVGVFTAQDIPSALFGRRVRDMPMLARDQVRFVGEAVAAVVAETRRAAEEAAALVDVDYDELPPVLSVQAALQPWAPLVHDTPWDYPGAVVVPADGANRQSHLVEGDPQRVDDALAASVFSVERAYSIPAVHQGYLEPQAWLAAPDGRGGVRLWASNKAPYRLRDDLARPLGLDPESVRVEPVALGGDFGGKGSPGAAPLVVAVALALGRPVRLVLRSGEDIMATDARHSSAIRIRLGCDREGRLLAAGLEASVDGGAYAGCKPRADVNLHGLSEAFTSYRIPAVCAESTVVYTNTVPRGHMRSPGSPEANFAVESALDELALAAGMDPIGLRRRNLVSTGEANAHGQTWAEARGEATLDAALASPPSGAVPPGWRYGEGLAVYARATPSPAPTSVRLQRQPDETFVIDVPIPETGTGSHSVVRALVARGLGVDPASVSVRQASTAELGSDRGVGGSRVTVGVASAIQQLVAAWQASSGDGPVTVDSQPQRGGKVGSFCVQRARVAVDPVTCEFRLLELVSAVDVADVVNPAAHQMQIDGGATMGFGTACLEDLQQEDGQMWSGTLGEFRLPTAADLPPLTTVLVGGGQGQQPDNVKAIGELTNVPTAAAVANAIAAATGGRLRSLPLSAEKLYWATQCQDATDGGGRPPGATGIGGSAAVI